MVISDLAFAARRGVVVVFVLLLLSTGANTVSSGSHGAAPADFIRGFGDRASAMLADKSQTAEERATEFRHLFTSHFDVDTISRYTLGKYWREASDEERAQYRAAFEDFIVVTYARRLEGYGGFSIEIGEIGTPSKQGVAVESLVLRSNQDPLQIVWRLQMRGEGWRIVDLIVDGVSLALTQRSEFTSVLKSSDGKIDKLIQRLRKITQET